MIIINGNLFWIIPLIIILTTASLLIYLIYPEEKNLKENFKDDDDKINKLNRKQVDKQITKTKKILKLLKERRRNLFKNKKIKESSQLNSDNNNDNDDDNDDNDDDNDDNDDDSSGISLKIIFYIIFGIIGIGLLIFIGYYIYPMFYSPIPWKQLAALQQQEKRRMQNRVLNPPTNPHS